MWVGVGWGYSMGMCHSEGGYRLYMHGCVCRGVCVRVCLFYDAYQRHMYLNTAVVFLAMGFHLKLYMFNCRNEWCYDYCGIVTAGVDGSWNSSILGDLHSRPYYSRPTVISAGNAFYGHYIGLYHEAKPSSSKTFSEVNHKREENS